MFFFLQSRHVDLCILHVTTEVLDLPEVVITDSNASSDYASFAPAPKGLSIADKENTFAEYSTHLDPFEAMRRFSSTTTSVSRPHTLMRP